MPNRAPATGGKRREETTDGSYFGPLAQGRYFLMSTPRPKSAPVSVRVQGMVDGDQAYFRVWSGSGMIRRLRHADQVQVTACDTLGLVSHGEPMYAAVRPLAGQEASRAAEKLAVRYPGRRDFLARLLRRRRVHYELRVP